MARNTITEITHSCCIVSMFAIKSDKDEQTHRREKKNGRICTRTHTHLYSHEKRFLYNTSTKIPIITTTTSSNCQVCFTIKSGNNRGQQFKSQRSVLLIYSSFTRFVRFYLCLVAVLGWIFRFIHQRNWKFSGWSRQSFAMQCSRFFCYILFFSYSKPLPPEMTTVNIKMW